jgi:hypothetical protein
MQEDLASTESGIANDGVSWGSRAKRSKEKECWLGIVVNPMTRGKGRVGKQGKLTSGWCGNIGRDAYHG